MSEVGMLAVVRVFGDEFDVDAFLASNPVIKPEKVWHKGEYRSRRARWTGNGVNIFVAEEPTWRALRPQAINVITNLARALAAAQAMGAGVELDFGIVACETGSLVISADLSPEDMKVL